MDEDMCTITIAFIANITQKMGRILSKAQVMAKRLKKLQPKKISMIKLLIPAILFSINGCSQKNALPIDSLNAKEMFINVSLNDKDYSHSLIKHVTHADTLITIIKKLNDCTQETLIFSPTHTIEIFYNDNRKILVLLNGHSMKLNGKTYKMKANILEIISN